MHIINSFSLQIKRVIVITARIHPGETIASWMMKGLLDYLTSNEADAKVHWLIISQILFRPFPVFYLFLLKSKICDH